MILQFTAIKVSTFAADYKDHLKNGRRRRTLAKPE